MDTHFLLSTPLFQGIAPEDLPALLKTLSAYVRDYRKGEEILAPGMRVKRMGVLLSGSTTISLCDAWGHVSVLARVSTGKLFAESYACMSGEALLVSVRSEEAASVLFISAESLLHPTGSPHPSHVQCLRNLLLISVRKNLLLSAHGSHCRQNHPRKAAQLSLRASYQSRKTRI